MKRNRNNIFKTCLFVLIFIAMTGKMDMRVLAETFVIDENSTYVDANGKEKKYMTIENNKWVGFQGCLQLREQYGDDNELKIIVPAGVTSMGCEKDYDTYCDGNDVEPNFDICFPTEIVLPKSCKTINHMDFLTYQEWTDEGGYDVCSISYIEQINLENVQYINYGAFRRASIGKRTDGVLDLSKTKIKEIGSYSFAKNDALKKVIIGNKLKNIPDHAFSSCANLNYVIIEYGVKSIGSGAFSKTHKTINHTDPAPDYKITVEIPASVTKIDSGAFFSDYGNNWYLVPNPKAKIITPKNSYAHKWAKKNGIKVQAINVKKPSNVTKLKATDQTKTSVKLTYNAGKNAEVYEIYQLKGATYKKIATTTQTTYTVKNLKAGTTYKFKVVSVNETKFSAGRKITTATQSKAPVIRKISAKKNKVTLSWKKVKGATGYEIYRSTDGETYKLVKDVSTLKYTTGRLKKGSHYFKIKAYIRIGNNKIYSDDSKVKMVQI